MAKDKFFPDKNADKREKVMLSVEKSLLHRIDACCEKYDINRSKFIAQCVQFAMDRLSADDVSDILS